MNNTNIRPYQICTRCVMDTSASDITFDEHGICNYCTEFWERCGHVVNEVPVAKQSRLDALVARLKKDGQGKPYDCIVGVSGGVDSSWTLYQAVSLGLRPLAVHMDNCWNTELSQNNIYNLVRGLGVDLYTHVINNEEYLALLRAFFTADVINLEILYDNAMLAVNYRQASRFSTNYILAGTNQATEGFLMPPGWSWFYWDKRNIEAIGKRFAGVKLNTFPAIGTLEYIYYRHARRIKWLHFLDYLPYNKFEALDELERKFGYVRYPFKHYESVFTRFFQGYILPNKFGVDKRKLHLSTLVAAGQMTREEALAGLAGIPYPSEQSMEDDINYFLKRMNWTRKQLNDYLARPVIRHDVYPTEKPLWDFIFFRFGAVIPEFLKRSFRGYQG